MPRRDTRRARRIEIEHVVPAENFGRSFIEWREGHATCVNKEGKPLPAAPCPICRLAIKHFNIKNIYHT